jgi:hypothetical protein
MYPFNRSFDPSRKHKYRRVPAIFGSPAAYLKVQETNCKAELSACVRDNHRLAHHNGIVVSRGGDARAVGETCTVEITNADNEDLLSKHLLRSPQRSFHIVSRIFHTPPDEHDPDGRHMVVVPHLPPQFEVGQAIIFDDFGFVGDAVRQMEAIRKLRQRGPAVPLLRVVADPSVHLRGEYRAITTVGNPWGANEEQLATLHDGEDSALQMIQGPPGCGKTKLIADILSERIPSDATALATSTSRQAIDNLCEKVESVAPGMLPVVLGNRNRFLDPDSLKKNKKNNNTPPDIVYRWLYKLHLDTQVERDPEVVATHTELDWLKLEQDNIPRRLAEETAEEYYLRVNLAQAQRRSAIAQLGPLSPDVLGMVCSQERLQVYTPTYFHRLAMRMGRASERLEEARVRAKDKILAASRVFVCTVGSVHYATEYSACKNLTTIVVDESSRLCEMDVPRLLVASPALKNMLLVGDQRQLEPFSNSQGLAAKSSLMQRFELAAATFHRLTEQYRMDPGICHLISQFTYAGKLRTNATVALLRRTERIPGRSPLQFHGCDSGEEQQPGGGSRSFRNLAEVDLAEQLYLQERQLDRSSTITVITFYAAQVAEITNRLRRYNDPRLTVCTVDKAQGSEADVIILSCVRTTKITMFGQDKKRMTVALSRAKNRLHIVGCREALETSDNWRWVLRMMQI